MSRAHDVQWNLLIDAWNRNRLSHAYLFSGNDKRLGKEYALRLACLIVCVDCRGQGKPCMQCPSCQSVLKNTHPDIHVVAPDPLKESRELTISSVRALSSSMSTKPWASALNIAIVFDAHEMNVLAQNALLKLLEEPPGRALFLLCTTRSGALIDTVRSRTQEVRWYSFASSTTSDEARYALDAMLTAPLYKVLRLVKKISEDPERARAMAEEILVETRTRMLKAAAAREGETLFRLKKVAERVQEGVRQMVETNASPLLILESIALSVSY